MSPTTSGQSSLKTLTAIHSTSWNDMPPVFREGLVIIALMCTLYGVLVLLCGASIYALTQKWLNNRNHGTSVLVLGFSLLALLSSTTIHTVAMFRGWAQILFAKVRDPDSTVQVSCCGPTAALTINILLGDAIVCWRAYILWKGNRIVLGACAMLLLTTFALGVVDTRYTCKAGSATSGRWKPDPHADGEGELYEGFSYGVAATVFSLCTNLFSTVAVAIKTWQSRRFVKRYIVAPGPRVSQVQRIFTFLVESGVVYCTLWVFVLAWQAGKYEGVPSHQGDNSFWDIFTIVMEGAVVPLIAIYPTVIIVVIALNRSHVENGFAKASLDSSATYPVSLAPLAVAVNTTVVARCDSQPRGMSETVLVIGEEKDSPEKGSSTHTTEA